MKNTDVIRSERPEIAAMLRSEAAREAVRRGCLVTFHDPLVQQNVATRILAGIGRTLRIRHTRRTQRSSGLGLVTPRLRRKQRGV